MNIFSLYESDCLENSSQLGKDITLRLILSLTNCLAALTAISTSDPVAKTVA